MHFYDFVSYCGMLTDESRLDSYVGALKDLVTPDSVVLDLGAGTGVFSVIACELGAKKVYAVDVNPLIKLVAETAKERGFAERLEVIQKHSKQVELEEKADILVTDIHGGFPLYESSLETIIDARTRLLAPDAAILPSVETMFFAPSESEEIYEANVERYLKEFHGFKIPASERLVRNRWFSAKSKDEHLLAEPQVFAVIDHSSNKELSFSRDMEWTVERDGKIHGLRGWFENVLYGDWKISNDIFAENSTYASPYFPLESPVVVKKGDVVQARLNATYEKETYAWSWSTTVYCEKKELKADFKQTVMASLIIDSKSALKRNEFHAPSLSEEGKAFALMVSAMDGETLAGDIADLLLESFPDRFTSHKDALEFVFDYAERYCE